jgi:HK97 family phage major capsid protein
MHTFNQLRAVEAERDAAVQAVRDIHAAAEGRNLTGEEQAREARFSQDIVDADDSRRAIMDHFERSAAANEARAKFDAFGGPTHLEARLDSNGHADIEMRDLTKATDANTFGGVTVRPIVEALRDASPILAIANTINTADGDTLVVPFNAMDSVSALTAEGATITEDDPTISSVSLAAYKYALSVQASYEAIQDGPTNLTASIEHTLGEALGAAIEPILCAGTGTGQPLGYSVGFGTGTTVASATAVTMDELLAHRTSIAPAYRKNAAWVMNDATAVAILSLKDSNNAYLLKPASAGVASWDLWGQPVVIDNNLPTMATGTESIAYGDFKRGFMVRVAGPVRVERSDDFAFTSDLSTWRAAIRIDSAVVDSGAVKMVTQG